MLLVQFDSCTLQLWMLRVLTLGFLIHKMVDLRVLFFLYSGILGLEAFGKRIVYKSLMFSFSFMEFYTFLMFDFYCCQNILRYELINNMTYFQICCSFCVMEHAARNRHWHENIKIVLIEMAPDAMLKVRREGTI